MTPEERCRATLGGERTDRAPIIGGFVCQEEFLVEASGVGRDEFWRNPRRHALAAYRTVGTDAIVQFVLPKRPEEATEGADGKATNFSKREDPPEKRFPTPDSVVDWVRARPDADEKARTFDREATYANYRKMLATGIEEMAPMVWIPGHVAGCPAFMWYGEFGYAGYFEAMINAPDVFERFFAALGEERRLQNVEYARAVRDTDALPVVYCGEDICYRTGPMVSPKLLSEIYFPHLKRALEPLREAGLPIVWHSDGNIMPIIDQLLDAGVDGFQGLEEEHGTKLDVLAGMTNRDGVPLVLWGSVSVTRSLPLGTVADVEADVERCLDIGASRGRLFLAPSSSVGPEVPTRNIAAFHRHGVEYGAQAYSKALAPA